jgi:hypothetical protein
MISKASFDKLIASSALADDWSLRHGWQPIPLNGGNAAGF